MQYRSQTWIRNFLINEQGRVQMCELWLYFCSHITNKSNAALTTVSTCLHMYAKAPATLSSSSQRVNVPILPAPKVIRAGVLILTISISLILPLKVCHCTHSFKTKKANGELVKSVLLKKRRRQDFDRLVPPLTLMYLQYLPYPCVCAILAEAYSLLSGYTTTRVIFLLHNLCNWWFTPADQYNNN